MNHQLTLELPDDVYKPLTAAAQRMGATPEALAVAWLTAATCHAARDPVEDFIGAFRGGVPDWADQHDKHLGHQLLTELRGEKRAGE